MIPLVDTHCHVLPALDDGAQDLGEAVAMCRRAWEDGTRVLAATAHLGEQWPDVTPERIRRYTQRLSQELRAQEIPLTLYPAAEVMIRPNLEQLWQNDRLLGMADGKAYLLVEFPAGSYFEIGPLLQYFEEVGVRLIVAHPERHPELLHDPPAVERLLQRGCLLQVCAESIVHPRRREDEAALKRWIRHGVVHLVASDGHGPVDRPASLAEAFRKISAWAGADTAVRLCSIHGLIVLEGLALRAKETKPAARRWFSRLR